MVYGIDCRKPVVKFYRGALNSACTNLCVFNPSYLNVQEFEPESPIDFTPIKSLLELTDDIKANIDRIKQIWFDRDIDVINKKLGEWIHKTILYDYRNQITEKVKIASSNVIAAYKALFIDDSSDYYVKPTS